MRTGRTLSRTRHNAVAEGVAALTALPTHRVCGFSTGRDLVERLEWSKMGYESIDSQGSAELQGACSRNIY